MPVKPHDDHADDLADRIVASMTDLAGALGRLNDLIAQHLGIAQTDLLCLHALNRAGASTAGALSSQLGRTTGAVTHMIDRLEKAGYVRRQPDPTDRRRVLVEASAPGLERIASFYEGLDVRSRRLMATFSGDQLATIHAFLLSSYEDATEECDHLIQQRGR
ncbi:MarR family winged helix-turn-helix transcriptional regulator [Nonomuraea sp. NEAU-A123]|uniref:MarR family winged helix-turn-helix transcriptional regulator n=1 Tax=Nonomuraea sp. NEAU-A123 TaxID=2839649 RepID=UPI001BE40F8B|nr:MarR family transcriptional regulator [Nonomuraea sp. NEAU-A123]MBT2235674.1 MarR family transcriptional regulator [Nonomuraea sp. NEAU-A123]